MTPKKSKESHHKHEEEDSSNKDSILVSNNNNNDSETVKNGGKRSNHHHKSNHDDEENEENSLKDDLEKNGHHHHHHHHEDGKKHRRHRRKIEYNEDGTVKKRRRRRRKRIIRRVVIRKHRHHYEGGEQKEDVVVERIRKRRPQNAKKVVSEVVIKKQKSENKPEERKPKHSRKSTSKPERKINKKVRKIVKKKIMIVTLRKDPSTGKEDLVEEEMSIKISANKYATHQEASEALDRNALKEREKSSKDKDKYRKVITVIRKVTDNDGKEELVNEKILIEVVPPEGADQETKDRMIEDVARRITEKRAMEEEEVICRKYKKRPKKRIVQTFVKVVKSAVNSETGKEEATEEKVLVLAPVDETMEQGVAMDLLQDVAKEEMQYEAKRDKAVIDGRNKQIVQDFINSVQKVKDPETGEEKINEEFKLFVASVPKDISREEAAKKIESIAVENARTQNLQPTSDETKFANKVLPIIRRRTNPKTGKEEVIEEKKIVTVECGKNLSSNQINDEIEKTVTDAIDKRNQEEENSIKREAEQQGVDAETVKKLRKHKKKKVVQQFVKIVKKVRNPETNANELLIDRKLVLAEVDEDTPEEEAKEELQQAAKDAIAKEYEDTTDPNDGNVVASNIISSLMKARDPETGKDKITEETLLVAEKVDKDMPEEKATANIEKLALMVAKNDAGKSMKVKKGNKISHEFVNVIQKVTDINTGIDEVVSKREIVSMEVPNNSTPNDDIDAAEAIASEYIANATKEKNAKINESPDDDDSDSNDDEEIRIIKRKKRAKKKVVQNFVSVIQKKKNPKTGKDEIVENRHLIAVELPEDAPAYAEQVEIEDATNKAIAKRNMQRELAEAEKEDNVITEVDEKTGKLIKVLREKPTTRVAQAFVTFVDKTADPNTGEEQICEEKRLIEAVVPIEASADIGLQAIQGIALEVANEIDKNNGIAQKDDKRMARDFINAIKKKVNPLTNEEEVVEEKQLISVEVDKGTIRDVEDIELEKLAKEHSEMNAHEEAGKDKEAGKKHKHKKYDHQFVTVIKRRRSAKTGKDELYEEKQIVEVEVPDSFSQDKTDKEIQTVAEKAVDTIFQKKMDEGRRILHEAEKERDENEPERKIAYKFLKGDKSRFNPETGKRETFKENQIVAVEVNEDTKPEVIRKSLQDLYMEKVQNDRANINKPRQDVNEEKERLEPERKKEEEVDSDGALIDDYFEEEEEEEEIRETEVVIEYSDSEPKKPKPAPKQVIEEYYYDDEEEEEVVEKHQIVLVVDDDGNIVSAEENIDGNAAPNISELKGNASGLNVNDFMNNLNKSNKIQEVKTIELVDGK